jgi:hypothetical protein
MQGPSWYIDNQDVKLAPNDKIEVKGSRITFEGHSAIVASEAKKGDEVLVLRNSSGFPRLERLPVHKTQKLVLLGRQGGKRGNQRIPCIHAYFFSGPLYRPSRNKRVCDLELGGKRSAVHQCLARTLRLSGKSTG